MFLTLVRLLKEARVESARAFFETGVTSSHPMKPIGLKGEGSRPKSRLLG